MKCQWCGQRDAELVVKFMNDDGSAVREYLCTECAPERRRAGGTVSYAGKEAPAGLPARSHAARLRCPSCQLSWSDFMRSKRLGCPACYDAFDDQLAPLVCALHGDRLTARGFPALPQASRHNWIRRDILRLERLLSEAVIAERYEEAARLRDELSLLRTALTGS